MKVIDTLSIMRFIKSIILSASFELQNCVKISSHTSEPVLYRGSYMYFVIVKKEGEISNAAKT
jgi:hypothetical protein